MKTIGVIGLGSIGMRHAKNLLKLGYRVMSYDPAINGTCADVNELITCSDAIVITSPTPLHAEHLEICAEARKPIFVEKPILGVDPKYPDEIQDVEITNVLMVGYNLRFHSCVKRAKEWLDAGHIGKPLWANFTLGQWNDKPAYLRDGVILNWSHEIDLALYLLGAAKIAASSTRLTHALVDYDNSGRALKDDMTDILLTHENGCRSTVHLDYITKPEQRYFSITGDGGVISVNTVARTAHLWVDNKNTENFIGHDTWNDNYIEEMRAFIDRIDWKEAIGCTGEEGLEVLKICLEVRKQAGLE